MATVTRRALALATALGAVVLMTLPAAAAPVSLFTASDFYIPRPATASDQVGVLRLLITFDVAAAGFEDLIGQTCAFTVTAANGTSVHLNNYGALFTGDGANTETDILDTESLPDVVTTTLTDATLTIGPVITLYNVMLPDADGIVGTSVDYEVFVDCEAQGTTTTTAPTTTTTAPTTTTTAPTTTTTAPTTTTTAPTTTTTAPETTTSSVLGTTTTTAPATTSSSVSQVTSTTVPPVTGSTLPFTGPPVEAAGIAMAATALMLLGGGVLLAARRG